MGVLATLAAALFPDYVAGTNTPYSPPVAALRRFAAAIDNAIPNAQDLSGEVARAEAAEADLLQGVRQLGARADQMSARADLLGSRADGTDDAIRSFAQNIVGLNQAVERLESDQGSVVASSEQAVAASSKASTDATAARAIADALPAQLAASAVTLFLAARPGEVPAAFTTDLASGIAGVPPNSASVTGTRGRSLRITGAATVACLAPVAIEANRTYKVRIALSRFGDAADPAGDAIRFAVAWYGADRNQATIGFSVVVDQVLTVAAGRVQYEALFSLNPPDQTNAANPRVCQPPAGAVYFRPFLTTYGPDAVTDLEVLDRSDVTDAALVTLDLDAVLARLGRVETALNLPPM